MGEHSSRVGDFLRKAYPLPNPYSHNSWTKNRGQVSNAARSAPKPQLAL